mmetsp:Transcript_87255/g.247097  ORF Transcript_87255/g.247097 Transcript_87255/m.247097 type:complete len:223 (+) Transcript_87255:596-1264(+)
MELAEVHQLWAPLRGLQHHRHPRVLCMSELVPLYVALPERSVVHHAQRAADVLEHFQPACARRVLFGGSLSVGCLCFFCLDRGHTFHEGGHTRIPGGRGTSLGQQGYGKFPHRALHHVRCWRVWRFHRLLLALVHDVSSIRFTLDDLPNAYAGAAQEFGDGHSRHGFRPREREGDRRQDYSPREGGAQSIRHALGWQRNRCRTGFRRFCQGASKVTALRKDR